MSNEQTQVELTASSTILAIGAGDEGRLWVGAREGIFYRAEHEWRPAPSGQPLNFLHTFACAGKALLAGSSSGLIVFSHDNAQTWTQGYLAQVSEPITALALSPNFAKDSIALAGTQGAGILRSVDGGRTWRTVNRGLYGFELMALAVPPSWERGAYAYAATTGGFYYSINGGLVWNSADAGLNDVVVTSVTVSADFAQDGVVIVGTEANGLFRSTDKGRTWQPWGADVAASVNCLWLHPERAQKPLALLGTDDGHILRSTDGGVSWTASGGEYAPLMCFAHVGARLYAGLHEGGLLCSDDEGWTWWKMM